LPILNLTARGSEEERVAGLDAGADHYLVTAVAEQSGDGSALAAATEGIASTLRLMNSKQPLTAELLANLRRTIAGDPMWNEYDLHRRAHGWFANGEVVDLQSLNERVYDELFLTPSSDPSLGLRSDLIFSAIGSAGSS
jgi:hypothetical protein